ncbi:MAG TPA: hypothetical protein VID25_07795 [Candidatus Limnocylindrales bacterium]
MSELLTESFCERCGTRYTFESGEPETRRPSIKKARVLARGLKHFVLSDDSLETALAEGERDEDRERAALQLEAFHQTFNFCMDCRQYTCRDCWNDAEGRCLSCAPAPGRIESAISTPLQAQTDTVSRLDALLGPGPIAPPAIEAWPMEAAFALPAGDAVEAPAELDEAAPLAVAAQEPEAAPTTALAAEAEPAVMPAATAQADEPLETPAQAVPEWLAVDPEAPVRAPSLEEYLLAASAAQAAESVESVESAEAAEPEPLAAEPAVAEVEAEPEPASPEPVTAAATEAAEPVQERAPEPVAAEAPAPIFTPPPGGDVHRSTTRLPGWDMVAPDVAGPQPPPLPHLTASPDVRPANWFAARTNASIWDASSADIVNRPGSGVQSCVSCGLPLSAAAHFCRRCGARQTV